ncbi:hypothetical protein RF11_07761 [Thelohanellus kitauei]|uniref:Uncharacterized protein n=1 Tax=Thelohanellus kitauei TaxID=669202 RepID=A0A0C2JSU1_THEKT|nr:hypothetical protein RF11_07761 [Thelohanellus kitauei]
MPMFISREISSKESNVLSDGDFKCGKEFGDTNKADNFYDKAVKLGFEHKLSHTCVISGDLLRIPIKKLNNSILYLERLQKGQNDRDMTELEERAKKEAGERDKNYKGKQKREMNDKDTNIKTKNKCF